MPVVIPAEDRGRGGDCAALEWAMSLAVCWAMHAFRVGP